MKEDRGILIQGYFHAIVASYHKAHARSDLMWYDESLFMGKRTYETYRRIKQLIVWNPPPSLSLSTSISKIAD